MPENPIWDCPDPNSAQLLMTLTDLYFLFF